MMVISGYEFEFRQRGKGCGCIKKINITLVDNDSWFREMFSQYMMYYCRNVSITSADMRGWIDEIMPASDCMLHERSFYPGYHDMPDIIILGNADSVDFIKKYFEKIIWAEKDSYTLSKQRFVLLCDDETQAEAVKKKCENELLENELLKSKSYDTEKYMDEGLILLSDEAEDGTACIFEIIAVCKYLNASEIVRRINEQLTDMRIDTDTVCSSGKFMLLTTASACGGTGKTSLAVIFGRLMQQKKNRSVLALSISHMADISRYFNAGDIEKKTLNEYIYHLFAGDEPWTDLSSYIIRDRYGMASFYMADSFSELCMLEGNEIVRFIDSIKKSGMFDTLIVDLGAASQSAAAVLAENSDAMMFVAGFEPDGVKIAEEWINMLEKETNGICSMSIIVNRDSMLDGLNSSAADIYERESLYYAGEGENDDIRKFRVPYDARSFLYSEGKRDIAMTGIFAAAADSVLNEVVIFE